MASLPTAEELYPIRTVASLTGVNPITLRAWERRYGLIKPKRTDTGHRLYSKHNIDIINRAVELQRQGMSIGRVAQLLRQHLGSHSTQTRATDQAWVKRREELLQAISDFGETRLDLILEGVLKANSIQDAIRNLFVPALAEVGRRWRAGEITIAQEHFFAVYLRNKLGALFHHRTRLTRGQKILVACMPGELHEVGMLLFALAAHDAGYRPVMLGANMPLDGLPLAAQQAECRAIVLSASCQPAIDVITELKAMAASSAIPVFVGGNASAEFNRHTVGLDTVALGADIDAGLRLLRQHIGPPATRQHLQ